MNTNFLTSFLFLNALLPLLYHTANADPYDITQVIAQDPRFSSFNNYLTQSDIPAKINSRQGITVLVVNNHAMELISGKPKDVVTRIMSVHVLTRFFDIIELENMPENIAVPMDTLFKESGQAVGDQGILKFNRTGRFDLKFTTGPSGGSGTNVKAKVVNRVIDHAYFLSVLEINSLLIPPGIENPPATSTPQPHTTIPALPQGTVPATPQPPTTIPALPQGTVPATPQPPTTFRRSPRSSGKPLGIENRPATSTPQPHTTIPAQPQGTVPATHQPPTTFRRRPRSSGINIRSV